jgi:hypothetical protein
LLLPWRDPRQHHSLGMEVRDVSAQRGDALDRPFSSERCSIYSLKKQNAPMS